QGRVSCPYGQTENDIADRPPEDPARCRVPGTDGKLCAGADGNPTDCDGTNNIDEIKVPIDPQLVFRAAQDTVYCSCRCQGPDKAASYCECPSGYVCEELVRDVGVGKAQLVGSYCIKPGTKYDPVNPVPPETCDISLDPDQEVGTGSKKRKMGSVCGQKDGKAANPPI